MGMIEHEKVKLPTHLYGDLTAAVSICQQQNIIKMIAIIMTTQQLHHLPERI